VVFIPSVATKIGDEFKHFREAQNLMEESQMSSILPPYGKYRN